MTIDFATHQTAIETWVGDQLGIPVSWQAEQQLFQTKPRARLNIISVSDLGVDQVRWAYDSEAVAGEELVPAVTGLRNLTLSVLVESRSQTASGAARYYLEKLRTSIRKPSVMDALHTAGLALQTIESIQVLDEEIDGRLESRASLDFLFGVAVEESDATEAGAYVESADVTATIYDAEDNNKGWPEANFGG